MIADTAASGIEVTSTLQGDKHAMGIDAAAMAHIMNVLTDLYSDPEYAILREYSTNALDAQIEALTELRAMPKSAERDAAIALAEGPIHVTLPGPLSPFLKIKDFGIGLTADDIQNIYSRYGASTKRSSNEVVGMLGLGCKSALTYVSQFTIVSVKDDVDETDGKTKRMRVQVAVSREAEGGSMTVVDRRETTDAYGTEITIPAKRGNEIQAKAKRFFKYWKEGTVLVDGEKPERLDGLWLNDKMCVTGDPTSYHHDTQSYVVMGNVPYPVEAGRGWDDLGLSYGYALTVFVDIGTVDFVPSREALNYSSTRTIQKLKDVRKEFDQVRQGAIQREIDKAKTPAEALASMIEWHRVLMPDARRNRGYYNPNPQPAPSYTYKGKPLPAEVTIKGCQGYNDPIATRILLVPFRSHVQNRAQERRTIEAALWPGAVFVQGYDGKKFSAPQKKKLLKYVENMTGVSNFVLTQPQLSEVVGWVAKDRLVKWEEVNKIKLPRTAPVYGGSFKQTLGSYDNCYVDGKRVNELEAKDIDKKYPIYHYEGTWYHVDSYASVIAMYEPKATIVPLPLNRRDKFLRNFPESKPVQDRVKALAKEWAKGLSKADKTALAMVDSRWRDHLRVLDASKVEDPELKAAIKLAKRDLTKLTTARKVFRDVIGGVDGSTGTWKNPLEKYPLYNRNNVTAGGRTAQHTYLYLNAAHKAKA